MILLSEVLEGVDIVLQYLATLVLVLGDLSSDDSTTVSILRNRSLLALLDLISR